MKFRLILLFVLLLAGPVQGVSPPQPTTQADSTAAPPPPLQRPPQRAETVRNQHLAEQIRRVERETEVAWLGSGGESFLGLYRPDHSGKPFANLLILHDNQQHPDWPGLVQRLRTGLAAHGWNTLAIALPDYLAPPQPEESMPTGNATAQDTDPAPAGSPDNRAGAEYSTGQVPDIVDARARQAAEFLQQKADLPLVMVALGLSATIAAKKAQTMLIADIAGLVIIDPVEPASLDFKIDLDAMDLRIPVLDIAPEFNPRSDPVLRRNSASRARHEQYQQRVIRGAQRHFGGMEKSVEKAIRGWGERRFKPPA